MAMVAPNGQRHTHYLGGYIIRENPGADPFVTVEQMLKSAWYEQIGVFNSLETAKEAVREWQTPKNERR